MSLLLVDRDDTNLTSRTSLTDPQTPQGIAQVKTSDNTEMDDLALVDTTRHQIPGEDNRDRGGDADQRHHRDYVRNADYPACHHADGFDFDSNLCTG